MKDAERDGATMPDPRAFVRQIEAAIRIEEESLVNELSPTAGTGKGLRDAQRALDAVTGWIAELTPAEQDAPSCYVEKGSTLRGRFRAAPSAGCHPLVRPNYAYFNRALPRSVPQVVIITSVSRCFDTSDRHNTDANASSPAGCRANRALVETLDTSALRAWIR